MHRRSAASAVPAECNGLKNQFAKGVMPADGTVVARSPKRGYRPVPMGTLQAQYIIWRVFASHYTLFERPVVLSAMR